MRKPLAKKLAMAGVAGVLLIGAGLFTVPSQMCACEEPWMYFPTTFGMESLDDSSMLDGNALTAAAQRNLVGKPLPKVKFPEKMQPTTCARKDGSGLDCEFWIFSGPVREAGLRVQLVADANGVIRSARVTNLNKLFGRWRFES